MLDVEARLVFRAAHIFRQQETQETQLHLLVGKSETVAVKILVESLNRQITSLIQQSHRFCEKRVLAGKVGGRNVTFRKMLNLILPVFQQFDQKRRGASGEPVVLQLAAAQRIQHAERIIDILRHIRREMVAVVHGLQLSHHRIFVHLLLFREFLNERGKRLSDFLFGETADVGVGVVERDVLQVVQVAEDADVRELGHAGEEGEADVLVAGLEVGIETLEDIAELGQQRFVVNGLQQWLVVLVHQDDHLFPFLFRNRENNILEALGHIAVQFLKSVFLLP